MWLVFAFASAVFAGLTSILAKCGVRKTDSSVATAIRTVIVLAFSWLMTLITGSYASLAHVPAKAWLFLILSGLATGASWLCYFRALQLGDINKVVPVDKSSTVLTIVLAFLFLSEPFTWGKAVAVAAIAVGTYMMIRRESGSEKTDRPDRWTWFIYAALSAVFASLTAILGKLGMQQIDSDLGTAIRTGVVLVMAWIMVFVTRHGKDLKNITLYHTLFILLSGVTTGLSWLCYFRALQQGEASVVVPIDKMSIVVTILFAGIFLKERLSRRALIGLLLVVGGTLLLVV